MCVLAWRQRVPRVSAWDVTKRGYLTRCPEQAVYSLIPYIMLKWKWNFSTELLFLSVSNTKCSLSLFHHTAVAQRVEQSSKLVFWFLVNLSKTLVNLKMVVIVHICQYTKHCSCSVLNAALHIVVDCPLLVLAVHSLLPTPFLRADATFTISLLSGVLPLTIWV